MSLANPFKSSPPAVRKPVYDIDFGASADDWRKVLISIELQLGLLPHVDLLRLTWAADAEGSPDLAVGDTGSVKLGYDDEGSEAVFSGRVDRLRPTLDGRMIMEAVNGGADLARLRVDKAFEQQSAGDVVVDLTGQVGVDTASVSDGIKLPWLALDSGRHALAHVTELARRCGFPAYFDGDGALVFAEVPAAPPVASFSYGADLLRMEVDQRGDLGGGYQLYGEGAAGSQGDDAWCWLVKDPSSVKGEAGDDPNRVLADRALRTGGAAADAANGAQQAAQFNHDTARLWVPGCPFALPATTVSVAESPQDAMNGDWMVTGVVHQLARGRGFTSKLTVTRAGGGGLGGLLGGLL
jgi:phage protein D